MIHDWGLTYNIEYPRSAKKLRVNEKESFAVKLCPECNRTYEKDGHLENVLAEEMDIKQLKCLYNMLRSVFESYEVGTFKIETKEKK